MARLKGLVVTTGTTENRTDGGVTIESTTYTPLTLDTVHTGSCVFTQFKNNGTDALEIGYWDWSNGKKGAYIQNERGTSKHTLILLDGGGLTFDDNTVYHAGNCNKSNVDWYCSRIRAYTNVFLAPSQEGIYIDSVGICWHNASDAWTKNLIKFNSSGYTYVEGRLYAESYSFFKDVAFFGTGVNGIYIQNLIVAIHNSNHEYVATAIEFNTSGDTQYKHQLYLTGANASSSTSNTTQIVFGTTSNNHVCLTSNSDLFIVNPTTSGTTGQACIGVNGKNTWFTSSGNFGIGTSSPSAKLHVVGNVYATAAFESSDERLKDFGDDIEVDFDKLAALRKKYFRWKDKPEKQELGVSAQEIREIYPEIVAEDKEGYLHVDYARLSVVALAAIDKQEDVIRRQQEEIDSLKVQMKAVMEKLGISNEN